MTCPSCNAENPPGAEVCFHCRTILVAITRGTVVASRYEVVRPLGRGGMGTVYEAHDRVLDERVALKVIRGDLAQAPGMAERFRSEIKLARKVSHPNVCRIHEYGEEGGIQFISMELVLGTNLKEVLRQRGPLPAGEAIDVARQAAEGLAAIHEGGVIHRDLKTLNLTVDGAGRVRVMDFGIATRAIDDDTGPTGSGYVVGSPEYMSPEQARGRALDFRSDVYALGVVLFELLTGRVPFRGETPVATLFLHIEAAPPLEGREGAAIPASLVPVLRRALAKEPRDRFASAQEMAEALRAAHGASLPPGPGVHARWSRAGLSLAAGLVGLALTGAFVASRWSGSTTAPPGVRAAAPAASTQAVSPSAVPSPEPASSAAPTTVRSPRPSSPARAAQSPRASPAAPPPATLRPANEGPSPAAPPEPEPTPAVVSDAPSATAVDPGPTTPVFQKGALLVLVTPWADISIDGNVVGQTPLARIPLSPGPHSVLITHPDYQPFPRKVTIQPGETFRLAVDLPVDGVRRRP
jgi:eukaryotic-like serine/threonine-protein kinase